MSHTDSELLKMRRKMRKCMLKTKTKYHTDLLSALKVRVGNPLRQLKLLSLVSVHNTEAVEKLLEMGVNANSCDGQLRSALHLAASRGYADIVELLLKHGADPNKRDIIQNTPLHLAACTSNLKIITLLINGGADIRSIDLHGRNPLQLAESKLQMLQRSWSEGAIEMIQVRAQLKEIVDIMISLWKNQESSCRQNRINIDDLELMKLSINDSAAPLTDQMNTLLTELQEFSIK